MAKLTDYSRFEQTYRKKKKKTRSVLFLLFFLTLIITATGINTFRKKGQVVKTKQDTPQTQGIADKKATIFTPDRESGGLESIVQNALVNSQGDYAVGVKNLKTGESYYFNEHKIFESASLYKLFVMTTVFQKIQDGNLSQNDILSQKITVLNEKFRISSESAELKEGDITLPINSALTRMITISDNYSALLLAEKVRLSQVSLFIEQNGLTESRVGTRGETPATSAYDLVLFFQKLFNDELASKSYSQAMLVLLKNQRINNKLPKYLPEETEISHKTGELGLLSHDAGIVSTSKGDYIIVVLTQTPKPIEANEKIATLSKAVYDYFTK